MSRYRLRLTALHLLVAALAPGTVRGESSDLPELKAELTHAVDLLKSHKIATIEILHVPYATVTRVAVNPEMLSRMAKRCQLSPTEQLGTTLQKALTSESVRLDGSVPSVWCEPLRYPDVAWKEARFTVGPLILSGIVCSGSKARLRHVRLRRESGARQPGPARAPCARRRCPLVPVGLVSTKVQW